MRKAVMAVAVAGSLAWSTMTGAAPPKPSSIPERALGQAAQLRETALASDLAWRITESLTTEIGPRLPGTEADARAVAWAEAKFRELGFDRVWTEPVTFPKWVRRSERADVLGANAQPLALTALGGSPGGTVEAEVVRFQGLAALEAAPAGSLAGKIAFVDFDMPRSREGSGYAVGSKVRGRGPTTAAAKGALAFLMRPAGTDSHRFGHTGITRFDEGVTPIPSAALSAPDAQQLTRLLALGPQRVRVALDCGWDGTATSHNVIGEIRGSRRPDEVVLIGAHLDSWDLGTGAIDDGAGIGITMAAGALIGRLPKAPARTVRVVAFANEEQGLLGARAYAARHANAVARHIVGAESDFGAGRIYGYSSSAPAHAQAADAAIARALEPLGIAHMPGTGSPGPDIGPMAQQGMAWARLAQDGTDYFDLHHTADDTLDKIDPAALAQNAAAYAVFAYLVASMDGDFGSAPRPRPVPQPAPVPARAR
ncbi:M28 family peptidase [Lysobacter sp. N42]|uniref:M28 family peptidase n=1 Tax=Lysobacter sp. N42 TaxID=2545719 RepID=UPI001043DD8B|nr:M28 family peptidase [Lysobacter sp. N42]TCZ84672.1 peptidase M28 family protein [Lysobacter sp. N42]